MEREEGNNGIGKEVRKAVGKTRLLPYKNASKNELTEQSKNASQTEKGFPFWPSQRLSLKCL